MTQKPDPVHAFPTRAPALSTSVPTTHTANDELVRQWIAAAISCAVIRDIQDDEGVEATVQGIQGALGYGYSHEEAMQSLESALSDWVSIKLSKSDKDIPQMGGIELTQS
ncbi:MAG: hypothetical protein OXT07_02110 [bacterium]|nr:hypothetical protein [bacterium]